MEIKNTETARQWILSKWYEKVAYVCGWIFIFFFFLGFLKGFLSSLQ